jgi:hypothetical protein
VPPSLLRREAGLVTGDAGHLAGDQDRSVQQEAGLLFLDDLEPGAGEGLAAGGGDFPGLVAVAAHDGFEAGGVHGLGPPEPSAGRRARPWSGISMSATLSISVVTTTESTGSGSITTAGSTSCSTAAPG